MKEYQEPTATIVEFSVKDIVICSGSGGPTVAGGDTGTNPESILGMNGLTFN